MARQDGMRRPELIFLHSVSADGSDVPACDFQKAGGALPRRSRSVSTGKLRCPAKEVRKPHLIYTVCDEIGQTGDATRTGKHRARLIATLSDCVTAKRRRRAAPAAAVTGAAARAPAAAIRTGSFGFAPVGSSLVGAV